MIAVGGSMPSIHDAANARSLALSAEPIGFMMASAEPTKEPAKLSMATSMCAAWEQKRGSKKKRRGVQQTFSHH